MVSMFAIITLAFGMAAGASQAPRWLLVTEYDEFDPVLEVDTHVMLYLDPSSVIGGTGPGAAKRIFFWALKTYDAPDSFGAVKQRISCEAELGETWLIHFLEVRFYDALDQEVGTPINDFGPWIKVDPIAPEPNFYKLVAAAKKALS